MQQILVGLNENNLLDKNIIKRILAYSFTNLMQKERKTG